MSDEEIRQEASEDGMTAEDVKRVAESAIAEQSREPSPVEAFIDEFNSQLMYRGLMYRGGLHQRSPEPRYIIVPQTPGRNCIGIFGAPKDAHDFAKRHYQGQVPYHVMLVEGPPESDA